MPRDISITIERIDAAPFTIRRGDAIKVYFHYTNEFRPMIVVGLSPSRRMVRVSAPKAVRPEGIEVDAVMCYPADPAQPASGKKTVGNPLSETLHRFNLRNAPPGGWDNGEQVKAQR